MSDPKIDEANLGRIVMRELMSNGINLHHEGKPLTWGTSPREFQDACIAAGIAAAQEALGLTVTAERRAVIDAEPFANLKGIPLFQARAFICEECGRRNYCDLVEADLESLPESLRAFHEQEMEKAREDLEEAARLKGVAEDGVKPAGIWIMEPAEVRCVYCCQRFRAQRCPGDIGEDEICE